ncbi:unnamed protein product [Closterium sp. Naga37s-1]|nr:unnamed protein product [Closterium sp. Naga37s-1]
MLSPDAPERRDALPGRPRASRCSPRTPQSVVMLSRDAPERRDALPGRPRASRCSPRMPKSVAMLYSDAPERRDALPGRSRASRCSPRTPQSVAMLYPDAPERRDALPGRPRASRCSPRTPQSVAMLSPDAPERRDALPGRPRASRCSPRTPQSVAMLSPDAPERRDALPGRPRASRCSPRTPQSAAMLSPDAPERRDALPGRPRASLCSPRTPQSVAMLSPDAPREESTSSSDDEEWESELVIEWMAEPRVGVLMDMGRIISRLPAILTDTDAATAAGVPPATGAGSAAASGTWATRWAAYRCAVSFAAFLVLVARCPRVVNLRTVSLSAHSVAYPAIMQVGAARLIKNDYFASMLVQVLGVKESADLQEGFGFFVQHLLSGGLEKTHARGGAEPRGRLLGMRRGRRDGKMAR